MPAAFFDSPSSPRTVAAVFEMGEVASGEPPEWIHIFPMPDADNRVHACDGRVIYCPDGIAAIVAASNDELAKRPGPVDLDHEMHRWPRGGPASGWLNAVELRDDGVWGRWEALPRAAAVIADRSYRYTSSVLDVDYHPVRDEEGYIVAFELIAKRFKGFGLTNIPATETAPIFSQTKSTPMDPTLRILLSNLGLAEGASPEEALRALQGRDSAKPDPVLFADRSELNEARSQLAAIKPLRDAVVEAFDLSPTASGEEVLSAVKGHRQSLLAAEVDKAVSEGLLEPARAEAYKETFGSITDGIAKFRKVMDGARPIVASKAQAGGEPPEKLSSSKEREELISMCERAGLSADATKKALEDFDREANSAA